MNEKLTIFVIHPSDMLTDFKPHGDGLIVHDWLLLLATRGHRIHVATQRTALVNELPPNVILHPIDVPIAALHSERLDYALKVRRLFREISAREHIDVAHQFNPVVTGLSLGLAGLPVPVVLGTYLPRWPRVKLPTLRVRLTSAAKNAISFVQQRLAARLLLSTPAASEALAWPQTLRSKLVMMPHAVDNLLFTPTERPANASPRILFLANIMQRKGIFTLLEAFERIHREMPEVELTYAGGGFDCEKLRERVATLPLGLQEKIRFSGNVTRADVPRTLADCTVYCLPSHGEPYGMSALEAMASGKPMVVTNTGGLPHLVPDDGSIKVPPHQAEPLADALLRILRSPELQSQMGRVNRRVVEELHTPERSVQRLEDVYRSVAARPKRFVVPFGKPRKERSSV